MRHAITSSKSWASDSKDHWCIPYSRGLMQVLMRLVEKVGRAVRQLETQDFVVSTPHNISQSLSLKMQECKSESSKASDSDILQLEQFNPSHRFSPCVEVR